MTEAWFAPEAGRWVALLSLLAIAAALEPLAKQGRARALVMATYAACIAIGVAFLPAAAVGALVGQPRHVLGPLLVGGFTVTFPFAAAFREMQRIYRDAELRKTVASDL